MRVFLTTSYSSLKNDNRHTRRVVLKIEMSSSGKGKEKKAKKKKLSGYHYYAQGDEKERGEIAKNLPTS